MKPDAAADLFQLPGAIAIVGMAARFPGARNLEEFRRNLENGVEAITFFSDQELLQAGVERHLLSNPDYVKAAPLLEDADRFDAAFFEYSPREATIMDPQQRLFLECAWEALEDAGHAGDASGSATGVFSGGGGVMSTYLLSDTHFNPQLTGTTASLQHIGNDKDYLSTRVSYKLNLRGPSLTVQTACSTSLVAVHLACQSLLAGECDMALAGGTTVRVPQRTGYLFKEGNVFSRDGHCRAFDAAAEGTVFGSGIGVVVLKRLKDAMRDGDVIRAVIRSTAVNNDGSERKTSYWAPHAEGQADAMRKALAAARVDPTTIAYVEAHGTATIKGDPTEVRALAQAFGPMPGGSCAIGSVKSNIGHPESAAGIAGLIKAVLSLECRTLFPTLHYSRPNPEIEFAEAFYVNATCKPWPEGPAPRRAAVNSLGIGGTNAFVILEEAPGRPVEPAVADRPCHVLPLSAKSPEALDELRQRFRTFLEHQPADSFADICYSAGVGRAHFDHRLAVVASSTEEALARLDAPDLTGHAGHPPRVAFLFTGQGSQYVNMARELYRTHAAFRQVIDRCADVLSSELEAPLTSVLYPDTDGPVPIHDTAYTQPALFAIEYALATLWRSWGVEPAVVAGHSIGEIVAACVAGVMSLDDGLRLTAARGRLMQALPRDGGMAALRCEPTRAADAIERCRDTVSIAAINGPTDVVISGRLEDVEAVVADLEREGVAAIRLKVSHAFHSPLMDPMLGAFGSVARSVTYSPPAIPLISNVSGKLASNEVATPEYWVGHVREAVRFAEGVAAADALGVDVFLEIGPSPVLIGMARQYLTQERSWLPSLRPGRSDWRQMAESLGALYAAGARIDWHAFHAGEGRRRVRLPTYPFQTRRYWMDPPAVQAGPAPGEHFPLLGQRLRLPGSQEVRFESRWSRHSPAYLDDHRLFETVVVPGASHVAMALAAIERVHRGDGCVLEDVVFPQALTLEDDASRIAQLILTTGPEGGSAFQVMTLREDADEDDPQSWVVHATGRVARPVSDRVQLPDASAPPAGTEVNPDAWRARCTRHRTGADFYDKFQEAGYDLRGAFRWISNVHAGDGEVLCEMQWPELPDDPAAYPLYPSLIDACFQAVFSDRAGDLLTADAVYVPFSIRRFAFHRSPRPGDRLWCHVAVSLRNDAAKAGVDADITVCDEAGLLVASIEGCQLREVRRSALQQDQGKDPGDSLYDVAWETAARGAHPPRAEAGAPALWIVFADAVSSCGADLIERLQAGKQRCVRVDQGAQYRQFAADRYEIDGAEPDHVRRLLEDVSRDAPPCRGIVHLWSLDMPPMDDPSAGDSQERVTGSVLHLVQSLAQAGWPASPRLWLVTRGAQPVDALPRALAVQQAPLWGLGRAIALEHPELSCVRVDLDPSDAATPAPQLFDEVWAPDREDQVAFRQGTRRVPRLVRSAVLRPREAAVDDDLGTRPFQVGLTGYGRFDNLELRPLTRRAPGPGEVEIQVHAAGLNFRDVLNALGLLEEHYARHLGIASAAGMTFGFECAGTVVRTGAGVSGLAAGDDVIAIAVHGALASFVTVRREFVVPRPAAWTVESAAALPLAFLTACYGLDRLARLQPGERVLIHAAAGGVGQACVQWARHVGAEIFATASPAKWDVLTSEGVRHVLNSRTLDFAATIQDITNGQGVDVVVNTLSGAFVDRSFDVLKPGGRFVELGKRDVWSADDARQRRPDVSYFAFDLVEVAQRDPGTIAELLREIVDRVETGAIAPLPLTVFPASKIPDAFRYMAEARHIGKIVVSVPSAAAGSEPAASIREDASYLVTGGLGALGLEVAGRLVEEGARHIVLVGRRGAGADALRAIARLRQAGADVQVLEADVSESSHVSRLLTSVKDRLPPLRGIVHAAGVLDDGVLLQQTRERFRTVMAPKVAGAWNLHALTQGLPLDFFVCFSSVASLVGNAGQGNYAAANAFMDALAHHRRRLGLPGLSINWGPWDEIGMAAATGGRRQRRLLDQGFRPIAPAQGVRLFSQLLRTGAAQVGVVPVNWPEFLRMNPAGSVFFERVAKPAAPDLRAARPPDIRRKLAEARDPRAALTEHVRAVVGNVLGMHDPGEIDVRARLFDLGLESLMAVELRGRFEQSLGCPLRPTLLFDYPTIESLSDHLAGAMALAVPEAAPASPVPAGDAAPGDDLEDLGEDEIAERLARELATLSKAREP